MGIYNNALFSNSDVEERIGNLASFLSSFEGINAEVGNHTFDEYEFIGCIITFNGTSVEGFFGYKTDDMRYTGGYLKTGESNYIVSPFYGANTYFSASDLTAHVYSDEKCKFLSCGVQRTPSLEICLVTTDNNKILAGGKNSLTGEPTVDISELVFQDIADSAHLQYSYTSMFPYAAIAGSIDYLGQSYFVNGNGFKSFATDILRECSAVALMSTASLHDGNYLAIGTHCLAPLDEQEEEE